MEVKIIQGTKQIGGCITEITTSKGKILIDYGDNLDNSEQIIIPGLTIKDDLPSAYKAVFITHSHGDHIGCASLIKKDIPIYVNKEAREIHDTLCYFTKSYKKILRDKNNTIRYFEFNKPIDDEGIPKVTPFIADHSSYNSAMFLIEDEGKKILHTGDFRTHGKKGVLFTKTLKEIGSVDLLITEGTTLGSTNRNFTKEADLIEDFKELLNYDQIYFMCAGTNIDRIVNIYKSFKDTHHVILDLGMNSITKKLKNIPNSNTFKDVLTFVTPRLSKIEEPYQRYMRFTKNVILDLPFEEKFVVSIKQSMADYLIENKDKIKNACFVYSMWDGYIDSSWKDPKLREFVAMLKNDLHMDYKEIHTSGHASRAAFETLRDYVKPKQVIVIHTIDSDEAKVVAKEIFKDKLLDIKDGETIKVED